MIFMIIATVYSIERRKRDLDLFSPYSVFLLVFALLFAIKPLEIIFYREHNEMILMWALIYVVVGLLSFLMGYYFIFGAQFGKAIDPLPDRWRNDKTRIICVISIILGLVTYILIIKITDIGGIMGAFTNMWQFRLRAFTEGRAYLAMLTQFFLSVPLVIWFIELLKRPRLKVWEWFPFIAYLMVILFIFMSFGVRGMPINVIISLLISYHYLKRRIPVVVLGVIVAGIIFFIMFAGLYRAAAIENTPVPEVLMQLSEIPAQSYLSVFLDRIDALPNFMTVLEGFPTSSMDFGYGSTFLNFIVQPFPRSIFPEKPYLIGDLFTQQFFPSDYGWVTKDPSIFGELYMNLHIGGIVLGMFLLGMICRIFQAYIEKNRNNKGVILFYTQVFGFPAFYLNTGFNSSTTIGFLFCLVFVLVFLNLIRSKELKQS